MDRVNLVIKLSVAKVAFSAIGGANNSPEAVVVTNTTLERFAMSYLSGMYSKKVQVRPLVS